MKNSKEDAVAGSFVEVDIKFFDEARRKRKFFTQHQTETE